MLRLQTLTWFGLFWFWPGNRTKAIPLNVSLAKERLRWSQLAATSRALFLTGYTVDRICHALPVLSFAFQNERLERVADFFLTAFGNQFFKLPLDVASHVRAKFRRNFCPASPML